MVIVAVVLGLAGLLAAIAPVSSRFDNADLGPALDDEDRFSATARCGVPITHALGWSHGSIPGEDTGDEGKLTDIFVCPEAVADRMTGSAVLFAFASLLALALAMTRTRPRS